MLRRTSVAQPLKSKTWIRVLNLMFCTVAFTVFKPAATKRRGKWEHTRRYRRVKEWMLDNRRVDTFVNKTADYCVCSFFGRVCAVCVWWRRVSTCCPDVDPVGWLDQTDLPPPPPGGRKLAATRDQRHLDLPMWEKERERARDPRFPVGTARLLPSARWRCRRPRCRSAVRRLALSGAGRPSAGDWDCRHGRPWSPDQTRPGRLRPPLPVLTLHTCNRRTCLEIQCSVIAQLSWLYEFAESTCKFDFQCTNAMGNAKNRIPSNLTSDQDQTALVW